MRVMTSFTQPLCTADWLEREGEWDDNRLVDFRVPVVVRDPDAEWQDQLNRCCICGRPTTSGIFTRIDPTTVPYPRDDDD